jgi:hypothetical protein
MLCICCKNGVFLGERCIWDFAVNQSDSIVVFYGIARVLTDIVELDTISLILSVLFPSEICWCFLRELST